MSPKRDLSLIIKEKDINRNALLWAILPSGGHIYKKQYLWGGVVIGLEATSLVLYIVGKSMVNNSTYILNKSDVSFYDYRKSLESFNNGKKMANIALGVGLGTYVFSLIQAPLIKNKRSLNSIDLSMKFYSSTPSISLTYNF